MSKVCQRTQPLSCSRHKRNECKAQAALPTMMSGLDGCLLADVTWVGSGEKEGESFHGCFSAAQCWLGTVAEQGSAWSASIYILCEIVCICRCIHCSCLVCLLMFHRLCSSVTCSYMLINLPHCRRATLHCMHACA